MMKNMTIVVEILKMRKRKTRILVKEAREAPEERTGIEESLNLSNFFKDYIEVLSQNKLTNMRLNKINISIRNGMI